MVKAIWIALAISFGLILLPPVAEAIEEMEWDAFHADAYTEYADEFTALFNSIEFKCAKNGASMIRRPGDKSFRFVKKG